MTAEVEPTQDGMYDLNDIWRTFRMKENQRPSEWRNRDKNNLIRTENLQVGVVSVKELGYRLNMTLVTKEALYAFAMWGDFEFYMVVVQTFSMVVEGKLEEAADKASHWLTV